MMDNLIARSIFFIILVGIFFMSLAYLVVLYQTMLFALERWKKYKKTKDTPVAEGQIWENQKEYYRIMKSYDKYVLFRDHNLRIWKVTHIFWNRMVKTKRLYLR